jgi:hypothetical protein
VSFCFFECWCVNNVFIPWSSVLIPGVLNNANSRGFQNSSIHSFPLSLRKKQRKRLRLFISVTLGKNIMFVIQPSNC